MKNLVKVVCFFVIFLAGCWIFGDVVRPKRYTEIAVDNYHDEHSGFYELSENTLDVLYIGSSHVFSSISPEDIFMDYGITGYVQASSCQKVWQSYYYLEETYETQNPKVVVLDTFMVLDGAPQSEAYNREAIDKMKLSKAKLHSIKTAVEYNSEESFMSYLFPLLRYHDRWEELKEEDYRWFFTGCEAPAKGFLARIGSVSAVFNEDAYKDESIEPKIIDEKCAVYLKKIKELCEMHGSDLVLTKFPTCLWDGASSAGIRQWAQENKIPFLDYNGDKKLRNQVDIDWETESLDGGNHLNYAGAMKMSNVFGKYLVEEYFFEDKRKDGVYKQWHNDYIYYKKCVKNYELANTTSLSEYLERLKNENYVAIISCGACDLSIDPQTEKLLVAFGMTEEMIDILLAQNNLFVFVSGKAVYSEMGEEDISFENTLAGMDIKATSTMNGENRVFECIVDKKNVVKNQNGVQFVVLDPVTETVVDSCALTTDAEQKLCILR